MLPSISSFPEYFFHKRVEKCPTIQFLKLSNSYNLWKKSRKHPTAKETLPKDDASCKFLAVTCPPVWFWNSETQKPAAFVQHLVCLSWLFPHSSLLQLRMVLGQHSCSHTSYHAHLAPCPSLQVHSVTEMWSLCSQRCCTYTVWRLFDDVTSAPTTLRRKLATVIVRDHCRWRADSFPLNTSVFVKKTVITKNYLRIDLYQTGNVMQTR